MGKRPVLKILAILALLGIAVVVGGGVYIYTQMPSHSAPTATPEAVQPSGDPVLDGIRRGLAYLKVHQEEDGHFVSGRLAPKPAFTGLVVDAFVTSPDRYVIEKHPFLKNAMAAILTDQKEDGSIHSEIPGMSFSAYSTAVALMALKQADSEKYAPAIQEATVFLKGGQVEDEGTGQGGFGYQPGSRPDLNNTCMILDALDQAGVPKDDPVWEKAQAFITRCQNRSESNDQSWAGDDGGFVYTPIGLEGGDPKGDERAKYASYGTMSYAGLVSFLYADADRSDPRVKSAYRWIRKHYDLHENVGKKDMGLYYYYRIMAKALAKWGEPTIVTDDGVERVWAKDLADRLLELQRPDGSWRNANEAFLEGDTVLVTAYAVRTLSLCHEWIQKADASRGSP